MKENAFSVGAGMKQLDEALHPGLVYEEQYDNFDKYLRGRKSVYDLNLPSFAVQLSTIGKRSTVVFTRELRDVDELDLPVTYHAQVNYYLKTLDKKVDIKVEPDILRFSAGERKEFKLTVSICPTDDKGCVDACLSWVSRSTPRRVVSPICLYFKNN